MKLLVTQSRNFSDYLFLRQKLSHLTAKLDKRKLRLYTRPSDKLTHFWATERLIDSYVIVHDETPKQFCKKANTLVVFTTKGRDWELEQILKAADEEALKIVTFVGN